MLSRVGGDDDRMVLILLVDSPEVKRSMAMPPAPHDVRPTFRSMTGSDVNAVFDLLMASFGEDWPRMPLQVSPREHLEWKISAPELTADPPDVVEIDGRIVGYAGGSSCAVWVRGRVERGLHGGDACIHPDYQARGLLTPWREWQEAEKFPVRPPTWGIGEGSTHPRLKRSTERQGNRVLIANQVERLSLPLKMLEPLKRRVRSRRSPAARAVAATALTAGRAALARARGRRPRGMPVGLHARTVSSFDPRFDALWETARREWDYARVRDRRYLNWRYADPRAGVYRIRVVEDGEDLVGFIVTGSLGGETIVVDLLAVPGRPDAARALVADVSEQSRLAGEWQITVMMPWSHPYRDAFVRAGFIRSRRGGLMAFTRREGTPLAFLEHDPAARVHVSFGDYDHI